MTDIVTLTLNPALDESCSVDRVVPEKKLRCLPEEAQPGGGGINVARVVHRLGGEVLAIWAGGGDTADTMSRLLDAEGVPHVRIPTQRPTRRNLNVLDATSNEQLRFVFPGETLSQRELAACNDAVLSNQCRYLVLSGGLPPGLSSDHYARLAARVPAETRIVLDTSGPELRHALEAGVFLAKPNLGELRDLVGSSVESDEDIVRAAARVAGRCHGLVVSLGSSGAVLVTSGNAEFVRSPPVAVHSRVGAGDSMVGGIVTALARGRSLADAVRYGVAAGAATVTRPRHNLCDPTTVERLFEQITS